MTLAQFCEKIALPDQVVERVLSVPEVPGSFWCSCGRRSFGPWDGRR